jgi:nitrogen fixation/metabolism regulation signal transduction histidine kinase
MPLALRERETEAVVSDVERALRLGSVLFLAAAAALAQTVSRRISGPIRQLTAATQRVAQGDLSARVAATSRDELRALVESFNQMASDLARQRADLERSNRLAAWAEMARQVAHEVKNPLTPIQLSAEHLRRVWADGSTDFATALRDCTRTILEQVRILRGIATEFSAFARPPVPEAGPLELRPLVDGVLAPYRSALPPGVRLEVEPGDGLPAVRADRKLIERALVNLVENALQAVGEQGTLTVRLAPAEQGVSLQVEDDGPGIDPEVRARIFEPFFSTKTGGSGLGLALVKKIAEDHGGRVSLESRPGRTVATLWLPAAAPDERLAGSRASSDQSNR